MKKDRYTAITEFTVVNPIHDLEKVGEKLKLSIFGEYCPDNSLRGYSLLALLDHPAHYRVSKITMKGISFEIPEDRPQNWHPTTHPDLFKYRMQTVHKSVDKSPDN